MTSLILSLLFVISANIDNIALGISFGIKKINITVKYNIIVSLLMSILSGIFMYLAKIVNIFINATILNCIGATLLTFIGIISFIKSLIEAKDSFDCNTIIKNINIKNLILLTLILSSNNIIVGIFASIAGISPLYTTIFTFIISFLFLLLGNKIGKKMANCVITKYAEFLSSGILIILGILEFLIN